LCGANHATILILCASDTYIKDYLLTYLDLTVMYNCFFLLTATVGQRV